MRTQFAGRRGMNHTEFANAVRAGHAGAILASLREELGIVALDGQLAARNFAGIFPRHVITGTDDNGKPVVQFGNIDKLAFDAQPEMVTASNVGIPAFLSNYLDPNLIEVLVSPMKAAEIAGERKEGTWVTTVTTFLVVESDGEVSAYGDYSNAGNADANVNYPQRQSFHYQVFTQWGEKELAYTGLAGIDLASRKNVASALVLNKFQNRSYFFGIAGLQNYGLLNAPDLLPPIVPPVAWDAATADQVFESVRLLYAQLVRQGEGNIDLTTRMTMALSPINAANLSKTNQFGLNVYKLISENFPSLRIKTAPEYSTASGELVQLIVDEYEGQETMTAAFTEKMRAHAVVVNSSSFSQKKSQGTWGTVIFRPVFIAQMLG
jgi:hypothetical protein